MNIEVVQESIVTQLQAAFTASSLTFTAQRLPESDMEYKKAVQAPICFVAYTGSTSPGVRNTNPTSQDRKLQFSVQCIGRILYGSTGLYVARDYVEKALIGFKPASSDRLYLVKDQLTRGDDTLWIHEFDLECMTLLVQDNLTDPVVVANFVRGDIKFENGGDPADPGNGDSVTFIQTS
jgi:hypothetical protein